MKWVVDSGDVSGLVYSSIDEYLPGLNEDFRQGLAAGLMVCLPMGGLTVAVKDGHIVVFSSDILVALLAKCSALVNGDPLC